MMGSALVPGVLMSVILGVAYTIDPHHEQEVREYLGTPLLCEYDALDWCTPDFREKVDPFMEYVSSPWHVACIQDGYTMEVLDVYGHHDGEEVVNVHNVCHAQWLAAYIFWCLGRHMWAICDHHVHIALI
jgi:hypothetical protein